MTLVDLIRAMGRRWPLVVAGAVLTAGLILVAQPQRVFWVSQVVTVVPPVQEAQPKRLDAPSSDPIPMAEILAMLINGDQRAVCSRNSAVTLYGEGFFDSSSARVRESGSQWVSSVTYPDIQVESTGATEAEAIERQATELARIAKALDDFQSQTNVPTSSRMTLVVTPESPPVLEVSGSRSRSAAAFLAVGVFLTVFAVYLVERKKVARSSRRSGLGRDRASLSATRRPFAASILPRI